MLNRLSIVNGYLSFSKALPYATARVKVANIGGGCAFCATFLQGRTVWQINAKMGMRRNNLRLYAVHKKKEFQHPVTRKRMKTASQKLLHEHNAILVALEVIEKMCLHAQNNKSVDPEDINEMVDFLTVFVNNCHHCKEEKHLFPALEEVGVKNQNGPIGMILGEHQKERLFIRQMQDAIRDGEIRREEFVEAASAYISLLRTHIVKENMVLFQISDIKFTEETQKRLLLEFESIEREVIGEGRKQEIIASIKAFKKKYA